ncbi:NADP-dependent oxidoreductase domain-containing protein [Aspergillus foveolatus]|uniref:NADP-dependent oxidoreductase domain-containing protein n=1 Tax=Aspergillus foveolatus TaxID=210207 RepID=UPI003CCE26AE
MSDAYFSTDHPGLRTLGPDIAHGACITSPDEFEACLDLFQRNGCCEIDTAPHWEERVLSIGTKPEVLKEMLEWSLRELGTDYLDIYYLHGPDRTTLYAETFHDLDCLYRAGKFKRFSLSSFLAFEVAEIVTMCNERSLFDCLARGPEDELVPSGRRYGPTSIFNPPAGGLFSGNTSRILGHMYRGRCFKPDVFDAFLLLEPLVAKHGLTLVKVALRWCVYHPALRATDRNDSLGQLWSNLNDFENGPLPDELVEALEQAWRMARAGIIMIRRRHCLVNMLDRLVG